MITLSEEQRRELEGPQPVLAIDPQTKRVYVLVRAEVYERLRPALQTELGPDDPGPSIPLGIRRSQEALRRELPQLLADRKLFHQWVAYHGEERIGIARDVTTLLRECLRRGLRDDEYYLGWIDPTELIEEEEVEHGLYEFDAGDEDSSSAAP